MEPELGAAAHRRSVVLEREVCDGMLRSKDGYDCFVIPLCSLLRGLEQGADTQVFAVPHTPHAQVDLGNPPFRPLLGAPNVPPDTPVPALQCPQAFEPKTPVQIRKGLASPSCPFCLLYNQWQRHGRGQQIMRHGWEENVMHRGTMALPLCLCHWLQ